MTSFEIAVYGLIGIAAFVGGSKVIMQNKEKIKKWANSKIPYFINLRKEKDLIKKIQDLETKANEYGIRIIKTPNLEIQGLDFLRIYSKYLKEEIKQYNDTHNA